MSNTIISIILAIVIILIFVAFDDNNQSGNLATGV